MSCRLTVAGVSVLSDILKTITLVYCVVVNNRAASVEIGYRAATEIGYRVALSYRAGVVGVPDNWTLIKLDSIVEFTIPKSTMPK